MILLTMHSTHFYLQLYHVRHMVKNVSAREETPCYHCMHHPTDRIVYTLAFVVEHRLEQEIALCVHHKGLIHHIMSTCSTKELHHAVEGRKDGNVLLMVIWYQMDLWIHISLCNYSQVEVINV